MFAFVLDLGVFVCLFWERKRYGVLLCGPGWAGTHCVCVPLSPECRDWKRVISHPVQYDYFGDLLISLCIMSSDWLCCTEILHSLLPEAERRPIGCCNCLGVIRMCFPKVVVLGVWYLLWQCWAGKPRGWKLVGILRSLGAGTCSEETKAVLKKFQLDPRKVNYCKKSELLGWVPRMPHTHACTGRASDH